MEIPKSIQTILGQLMATPSLDLARQLEQELASLGYRRSGMKTSDSSLTPRKATQRFLNPNPDNCDWNPQSPKIEFKMPFIQIWREVEEKRRFKRLQSGTGLCSLLVRELDC